MESKYYLTSDRELYHYGIKGMKWGVRRYQNEDGSLTEAGEKRLARRKAKGERKQARIVKKQEFLRNDTEYQKNVVKDASVKKQSARANELRDTLEKQTLDRRISVNDFWTNRGLRKAQDRSFDLNISIKKAQEKQLAYETKIQTAVEQINYNNAKLTELDEKYIRIGKKYFGE